MRIDEDTLSIFKLNYFPISRNFEHFHFHLSWRCSVASCWVRPRAPDCFYSTYRIKFIRFQTILCATKILNQFYSISSLLSHFLDLHFIGCLSREWSRERDWKTAKTTASKYDISAMKRENSTCHLIWVCELFWWAPSNVYGCPFQFYLSVRKRPGKLILLIWIKQWRNHFAVFSARTNVRSKWEKK